MTKPRFIRYEFAVIKYVHDILTGEFINIGVSISSPEICYINIKCRNTYGRVKKAFPNVDGSHFIKQLRALESKFESHISNNFSLLEHENLEALMLKTLPHDDSSLQWNVVGSGITHDIEQTFLNLYEKYVMQYEEKNINNKTDDDIWRVFKKDLKDRQILSHIKPYVIATRDDELKFEHTLKNGSLHCIEALSFDLTTPDGIKEKARNWLGKVTSIANSNENFEIYYLVGLPTDKKLIQTFDKALKILQKAEVPVHIYLEHQTDQLAEKLSAYVH